MAQSWLVFQLTHSGLKLGVVGFCQLLPRLVLGTVGGVIVDRFDRRRLLLVTQTVAMLQSIALWALVATGRVTFEHIVVLSIVLGLADTLHLTARHAIIPVLVPPSEMQAGVALNSAGINLTQVIGPSLGGALIGLVGVSGCLAINAISFVAILLALFLMNWRQPVVPERARATSIADDLKAGFRYVGAREALWVPVAIAYGVASLAMAHSRLLPVFATDVMHGGARAYGALMAAPGVGAVLASLWIAQRNRKPAARRFLYRAVLGLCLALLVFSASRSMLLSLAMLSCVGAAQMLFRTSAIAAVHDATDDLYRGRVISIFLLDYGLWSFGTLWLGWLTDGFGVRLAIAFGALSCLLCTGLVAYTARRLRAVEPLKAEA